MRSKLCVVTGTRAEYGLLYPLLKEMSDERGFETQLIVSGMHLLPKFGSTYREVEADGFRIAKKVRLPLSDDSDKGIARAVGRGIVAFSDAFHSLKPDMVILLGDRFEMFAAAAAAFITRIPIAHLYGGELTEGAMDDVFRHSITKMSLFHFVAAKEYRRRVIQLGEEPGRVFAVGALGIDNMRNTKLLAKKDLEKDLKFKFGKKTAMVTFHPVTLEWKTARRQTEALISALDTFKDLKIIFTMPNADEGRSDIEKVIRAYVKKHPHKAAVFSSLGRIKYLSALKHVDVVIGNSSSGIIEVPSFQKPSVNIGDRQRGRIKSACIINCAPTKSAITKALDKAFSTEFRSTVKVAKNPYGDGTASKKIAHILKKILKKDPNIKKKFYNISLGSQKV